MNDTAQPTSLKFTPKNNVQGINGQVLATLNWSGQSMRVKAYRSWDSGRSKVEAYIADVFKR